MKQLNIFAAPLALLILLVGVSAQTAILKPGDLKVLEGSEWTGTLTYLDYSSNKKTSIKSNVLISRTSPNATAWAFDMRYPLEPKANRKSDTSLSADGRTFDGEEVVERKKLPGGILRVITSQPGRDNDRDAVFRHTYLIGKKSFSIRKEVRFAESKEFFERNIYSWTR